MAKNRFAGRGATIDISTDPDEVEPSYNQVLLCRNITPPAASVAWIEMMGMEDTEPQGTPGIPEDSAWSFETLWDPDNAQDAAIRTAHKGGNKVAFRAKADNGTNELTVSWEGYITSLEPSGHGGNDPVVMTVGGNRVGGITEAVAALE